MHAHEAQLASATSSGRAPGVVETDLPAVSMALDGRLLDTNDALCRLVGRRRRDLVGRHLRSLTAYPTDAQRGQRALVAARGGTPCGGFTQRWHAGEGRPPLRLRLVWTLVRDQYGMPDSLMVFCLDETREAASARFWEALLTESADITWTADERGVLTAATPGAVRQIGRPAEELVGSSVLDLAHPEDRDTVREAWARLVAGSDREVVEYRLARAGGGWTPVRQVLTDHRDDPDVRAIVGNALDVSDLREAERAGGVAAARMRAQFDQSPVPQVLWDGEGQLTEANAAFCTLVGRTAGELVGRPAGDLLHRSDPGRAGRAARAAAPRREPRSPSGCSPAPRAARCPTIVSGTVLRDRVGNPAGVAASVQDLSGLRRLEARRERQESFFLALAQRAGDLAVVTDPDGLVLYASPALSTLVGYAPEDLGEAREQRLRPRRRPRRPRPRPSATCCAEGGYRDRDPARPRRGRRLAVAGGDGEQPARHRRGRHAVEPARHRRPGPGRGRPARLGVALPRHRRQRRRGPVGLRTRRPHRLREQPPRRDPGALAADEVHGRPLLDVLDSGRRLRRGPGGVRGATPERYEVVYAHPDGRRRTLLVSAAPLDDLGGSVEGSLAMVSDVTDARRLEDELRRAALHDTLTGLPNRALLFDRLQHALMRETRVDRGRSSWTSTSSRSSTTSGGTSSATSCSSGSRRGCRPASGPPTPSPASPATSSSWSARTSTSWPPGSWPRTCWPCWTMPFGVSRGRGPPHRLHRRRDLSGRLGRGAC